MQTPIALNLGFMQSLRDKLLKAGLVSKEQVEKAEKVVKAKPSAKKVEPTLAPVPRLPPLAGTKEHQKLDAKKQVALDRKIRQLVVGAQVPLEGGSRTFHFVTRKGRLRRLEISDAQAKRLERGELAVVERPDPDKIEHSLVPAEVALEILQLFPKGVRYLNREEAPIGFMTDEDLANQVLEDT